MAATTKAKGYIWHGSLFVIALLVFVSVRLIYWSGVTEVPFSDMADYIQWGRSWAAGDWMLKGQFWGGAYHPPGVPLLYAAIFHVAGGYEVDYIRYTQLAISLLALSCLALQIARSSGTMYAGLLFIIVVSITKSSIFWSFKAGTESLSEAFLYLSLAAALWVYEDCSKRYKYAVLAFFTVYATFVRPNLLPLIGVLVLFPLWKILNINKKQLLICLFSYVLTVVCVWSPWVVRNYIHCQQFVPLTTQGPYTFLWELGNVNLPGIDGKRAVFHVNQLQSEASQHFSNDCQASTYAMGLVKNWLKENMSIYPELIKNRLNRYTVDRQIDLTRVSRSELNPNLDPFLLDKTHGQVICSLIICIMLSIFIPWVRVISVGIISVVAFSSLFLGDARMFEPFIPLSIFMMLSPSIIFWKNMQSKNNIFKLKL